MKALLLDPVTTKIVSMVYSQTQILEKEVYLVEQLGKKHEGMNHLKAALFVQPTEANFELIARELKDPRFKEYHIFFTNIVPGDMLNRLGRMDELELIMQVQEYYGDYMAINEEFFHLGIENSLILSSSYARSIEAVQIYERNLNGVLSVLLSMKRSPSLIRYQGGSDLAHRLATDVHSAIEKESGLFDFRRQEGPLLLVLDRRDDPVTPLLTQWTYQAMVHELLGLNNNRVLLRGVPNITKDLEEVVLSPTQDEFFAKHRFANFGDLGAAVKALLDEYQRYAKKNENINSIEDMQNFLERYPDFRSKSINVSKHVAVISELSRLTDVCQLLDISELEQEIACANDHNLHKQELLTRIRNPKVKNADKLRLALLYLLRYESYNEVREIKGLLQDRGISAQQIALLDAALTYAGDNKRAPGLFSSGSIMAKLGKTFSSAVRGAENVYTQHQPLLFQTLDALAKGKLKDSAFPPLTTAGGAAPTARPSEVLVFIVGGATFEEAMKVAEFNAANPGMRVILGGSCVHNSTSFLKEIGASFGPR
jgi:vacuolar protein sorting-associated protein 45